MPPTQAELLSMSFVFEGAPYVGQTKSSIDVNTMAFVFEGRPFVIGQAVGGSTTNVSCTYTVSVSNSRQLTASALRNYAISLSEACAKSANLRRSIALSLNYSSRKSANVSRADSVVCSSSASKTANVGRVSSISVSSLAHKTANIYKQATVGLLSSARRAVASARSVLVICSSSNARSIAATRSNTVSVSLSLSKAISVARTFTVGLIASAFRSPQIFHVTRNYVVNVSSKISGFASIFNYPINAIMTIMFNVANWLLAIPSAGSTSIILPAINTSITLLEGTHTMLAFTAKDPADSISYTMDFSNLLQGTGETVSSVGHSKVFDKHDNDLSSTMISGLPVASGKTVSQVILGGVDNQEYRWEVAITSSNGNTFQRSLIVPVKEFDPHSC